MGDFVYVYMHYTPVFCSLQGKGKKFCTHHLLHEYQQTKLVMFITEHLAWSFAWLCMMLNLTADLANILQPVLTICQKLANKSIHLERHSWTWEIVVHSVIMTGPDILYYYLKSCLKCRCIKTFETVRVFFKIKIMNRTTKFWVNLSFYLTQQLNISMTVKITWSVRVTWTNSDDLQQRVWKKNGFLS